LRGIRLSDVFTNCCGAGKHALSGTTEKTNTNLAKNKIKYKGRVCHASFCKLAALLDT
jgi:hypothetical protein